MLVFMFEKINPEWMDGWMDGSKSNFKDCLQQSKYSLEAL